MSTSYGDRKTILAVDDTPEDLTLIAAVLKDEYRVEVAGGGERALAVASSGCPPHLILLDVGMPGLDGYSVCRRLKESPATRDVPVIFLAALTDPPDEAHGLELGAVDYVTKPISPSIVLARVKTHLELKDAADFLRDKKLYLERMVEARTKEVLAVQEVTILVLAALAETRDADAGNHLRRTQLYIRVLAERLRNHERFRGYLTEPNVETLFRSAPLHDIGKVGIPERVLMKPGRLDAEEFEIMKTHCRLGHDAIENAETALGSNVGFLRTAKEMALYHHEKWDGTGYPEGLAGDDIPISARLMALADVYDALTCRRIYRDGMPPDQVYRIVTEGRGSHFDPAVLDAFIASDGDFRRVAQEYYDAESRPTIKGRLR